MLYVKCQLLSLAVTSLPQLFSFIIYKKWIIFWTKDKDVKVNMILPGSQLEYWLPNNSRFTSRGHFCSHFQLLRVFKTGMDRKSAFTFSENFPQIEQVLYLIKYWMASHVKDIYFNFFAIYWNPKGNNFISIL